MRALAEWLYEDGIGETRAILVENGAIIEARVELPGLRSGTVIDAKLTRILIPGKRGLATLNDGAEVLIEPLTHATEGALIRVEIMREAIAETGAMKRAKGRIFDGDLLNGPGLVQRIGAHHALEHYGPDLFEEAGWSECLETAASGVVGFPGGAIRITLTPAMTLIDVDGNLSAEALALAGAKASAAAIRCFDISGNIGIDLPTVATKSARQAIADVFDSVLPRPYERTGVNGFGFLQIICRRIRPSTIEIVQQNPILAAARGVLRRAQRSRLTGSITIRANPTTISAIDLNKAWLARLSYQLGGQVILEPDASLSLEASSIR